jgi:polyisoprenoid-binding protein YceI
MTKRFPGVVLAAALFSVLGALPAWADEYNVDGTHAAVSFKIAHLGLSWTHGRFNDVSGTFTIDPVASKCSFSLTAKADSIDTNNARRDTHLRSPDFFNAKQFPAITFQSTSVQPTQGGYQVTGNLTLHGVTKPVTFALMGGSKSEFPKGVQRTGFSTELVVKRSEFNMKTMIGAIGDEVYLAISFEGVKK